MDGGDAGKERDVTAPRPVPRPMATTGPRRLRIGPALLGLCLLTFAVIALAGAILLRADVAGPALTGVAATAAVRSWTGRRHGRRR